MKHNLFFLFVLIFPFLGFSQTERTGRPTTGGQNPSAGQGEMEEEEKPPITDYKIISVKNDTTHVDTSLSLYDEYRFNYLRDDNFGLLPFSNVGQTYNTMAYDFSENLGRLVPQFGARARHFNFMEVEDIFYYRVPTPFTELFFKTVFEQGQILDALFTVNTSNNLNFSIAYKGMRSLGKYQHILTSTGNFRTTLSYNTPNKRYHLKAHVVFQDLLNEENGGLQPLALEQFLSGDEEFSDRSRLEVNFEDAQSTLYGKRFYLNHSFDLVTSSDTVSPPQLVLGHVFNYSEKEYLYEQSTASPLFGPTFESVDVRDEVKLRYLHNELSLGYKNSFLGSLKARLAMSNYNYGYNSVFVMEDDYITNRIKGNNFSFGATYSKEIGDFNLYADGMLGFLGDFNGARYEALLSYSLNEETEAHFSILGSSRAPNFNFLLYQSDYINFNWQNDFPNVVTNTLNFRGESKFLNLELDYTSIDNFTFFGLNANDFIEPMQYDGTVNYFKIKGQREFHFGRYFALDNTLLYQKVLSGKSVLNVPSFISRNSFYYSDHWFQEALYLQSGFTLNYFTNYHMNAYNPVLAEFYVQNEQEFEGFPTLDFFFNARIQQARIFFSLEHVNSLLMGNDNFSAPLYPYRDFAIRFGVVWDFFM